MAKDKSRYFTFLLYPESIPEDWQERLESIGVPIAISPLHNMDARKPKNLDDLSEEELELYHQGKLFKKPHYHLIYVARNPVTADSVRVKIKRVLGEQSLAKVQIMAYSMEHVYLYLTHETKDAIAKNKYKYDKKDIRFLNNFDIDRYTTLDVEEKDEILNDVCDLIDEAGLANIRELRRFVKTHGTEYNLPSMKVLNSVLRSHTGLIRLYFDAVYQERKYGRSDVNKETGEIK